MLMLSVPLPVLLATSHDAFDSNRRHPPQYANRHDIESLVDVDLEKLPREALEELDQIAARLGAKRFQRVLEPVLQGPAASGGKVANFNALHIVLADWIAARCEHGWIWHRHADGLDYPYAVTSMIYETGEKRGSEKPAVTLWGSYLGLERSSNGAPFPKVLKEKWVFEPGDATNRRVECILAARGLSAGSPEACAAWADRMAAYDEVLTSGVARQFRVTGPVLVQSRGDRRDPNEFLGRRVICDTDGRTAREQAREVESGVLGARRNPEIIPLPRHPYVWVFDLPTHERILVSTDSLQAHVYDRALKDKLILPPSHAEMLDVLTTDIEALTQDIVEGKAAGNIILAKGLPGTGKTLTAEIYAELMERPLLRVHAGTLGTTAKVIAGTLKNVFQQARRWGSAILIDEADVFVAKRGGNIEQNAITAEFLRALEYDPGLMFMTTNRPDDIDEAVLSRCVAVFHFKPPTKAGAKRLWETMAENFGITLSAALIDDLVATYSSATGRDIKLMLRTAIRFAESKGFALDAQVMRRVAMTRGMIADDAYDAAA